jgi:hypothetical protein
LVDATAGTGRSTLLFRLENGDKAALQPRECISLFREVVVLLIVLLLDAACAPVRKELCPYFSRHTESL